MVGQVLSNSRGHGTFEWSVDRLRAATEAADIALWAWHVDSDAVELDEQGFELWGVAAAVGLTFADLALRIHPDDAETVEQTFAELRRTMGAFELDFRVVRGSEVRWITARGRGGTDYRADRTMFGVFLDATRRKEAEELRDALAGEMSHRVKNVFALAASLTSIAARSATTPDEMATDLVQRLQAVAGAHQLIRPAPGDRGHAAARLHDLFAIVLGPYDVHGQVGGRIHLAIPEVHVGQTAATTLALVIHELATNSVKYGALSHPSGSLEIVCSQSHDDEIVIVWSERGGPPLTQPRGPAGYGSSLISRSMAGQLRGSIEHDWREVGAVITLRANLDRLTA